jgi:hypothetical protein
MRSLRTTTRSRARRLASTRLALSLLAGLAGCRCSRLAGEVEGVEFTRCAQAEPPSERALRTEQLELAIRERVLSIKAASGLRIAAFAGPVAGSFAQRDFAALAAARPGLVLVMGGLGDDLAAASANLSALATLRVPALFVAGGADRLPLIEEAFAAQPAQARELLIHASGLRELRIGQDRFAVVSGAPFGRYALDAQACGFTLDDLDDVRAAFSGGPKGARNWLLSWGAPSGWGVSSAAGSDVGSPELFALSQALGVRGGVFAYPETQAGLALRDDREGRLAVVVPRLGRTGATRADGGRVPSSLLLLTWTQQGLVVSR